MNPSYWNVDLQAGNPVHCALNQGSHASWKVLDFFLDFQSPAKSWKISSESPVNESLRSWKVLEIEDPG